MKHRKSGKYSEGLFFLNPFLIIRNKHFSKKDVYRIKGNVLINFTLFRIIIASVLYVVSIGLMIFQYYESGGNQIAKYGFYSTVAQIVAMTGCLATIGLLVASYILRNKKSELSIILNRIGSFILISALSIQTMLNIYTDAERGFTTSETYLGISPSLMVVIIMFIIQPSYWIDAIISVASTTIGVFSISLYCHMTFGMVMFHYYAIVSFLYPFMCFFNINTLFYAECQHYTEIIENEKLNNKAYYDKLTQCKNRHALSAYLLENGKKWEADGANVLIILFDIDNFKLYNDQFSHLGGDYCLKSIADAIRQAFPNPNLDFFRYGGEEFLLFFELNDPDEAPTIMEQVRKAVKGLELEAPCGAPKDVVTISLGGMLIKDFKGFSFEEEMKFVDKYLYMAKSSGKDASCYNGDII